MLLFANSANALIVSLEDYGDVPETGLSVTLTEAEEDPMTGEMQMKLNGTLLCTTPLTVTITRSTDGLTDEFCCAGTCTAGNEERSETLHFTPSGMVSWFIHYTPEPQSDVTVVYTFTDNEESRIVTVRYIYNPQALETVKTLDAKHALYTLTGKALPAGTALTDLPEGAYIIDGKKQIITR